MPALSPRRSPRTPPIGPQIVSRRDPVAAGIVACYQPSHWNGFRNLAGLGADLVPLAAGGVVASAVGRSLAATAANPGAAATIGTSSSQSIIGSLSMMWYGVLTGDQSGTNPTLFDVTANNTDASPFVAYGLERIAGTPTGLFFSYATADFFNAQLAWSSAIDTTKYGQPLLIVLSAAANGTVSLYVNGVDQGAGTQNAGSAFDGNTVYTDTSQICLATYPAVASRFINGYAGLGVVWNRALAPAEQNLLFADPFRVLAPRLQMPPVSRQWVVEPGFQSIMPAY